MAVLERSDGATGAALRDRRADLISYGLLEAITAVGLDFLWLVVIAFVALAWIATAWRGWLESPLLAFGTPERSGVESPRAPPVDIYGR